MTYDLSLTKNIKIMDFAKNIKIMDVTVRYFNTSLSTVRKGNCSAMMLWVFIYIW